MELTLRNLAICHDTNWHYNPKDNNCHIHHHQNLISSIIILLSLLLCATLGFATFITSFDSTKHVGHKFYVKEQIPLYMLTVARLVEQISILYVTGKFITVKITVF